ncbi:uncharacterized protein BDZ99DRAFT_521147 [Mytilinidion resinicola]|uniref:Uncharacterized protein n=1 Tax=Mytilinidion resinicola TaxID=574789 RepID=A0A6A6YLS9_9PEZI|nr:uncharacterized protein BDZ99DRAFT_521147 [Mytilinidion resinicola]KAF2809832.1 hypothetical protein BDZ99DRAFT_521147 [Mytilinidion resinicola]
MVSNAHIFWNDIFVDFKVIQLAILMEQITKLAEKYANGQPAHAESSMLAGASRRRKLAVGIELSGTKLKGVPIIAQQTEPEKNRQARRYSREFHGESTELAPLISSISSFQAIRAQDEDKSMPSSGQGWTDKEKVSMLSLYATNMTLTEAAARLHHDAHQWHLHRLEQAARLRRPNTDRQEANRITTVKCNRAVLLRSAEYFVRLQHKDPKADVVNFDRRGDTLDDLEVWLGAFLLEDTPAH